MAGGKQQLRYFSPVSRPDDYGHLEVILKYETQGILSTLFKSLQPGECAPQTLLGNNISLWRLDKATEDKIKCAAAGYIVSVMLCVAQVMEPARFL